MSADELILSQPGTAMMQAPTPDTTTWTKIGIGAAGTIAGWLLKSVLMTGFKKAVLDSVKTELDERFKAHEERIERKLDEKIDLIRHEAQVERRGLPRR